MTDKEVEEARYYTRTDRSRNHQIVILMSDGSELRFTERRMIGEVRGYRLSDDTMAQVENAAYNRAIRFSDKGEDWPLVQRLLCELQHALSIVRHSPSA